MNEKLAAAAWNELFTSWEKCAAEELQTGYHPIVGADPQFTESNDTHSGPNAEKSEAQIVADAAQKLLNQKNKATAEQAKGDEAPYKDNLSPAHVGNKIGPNRNDTKSASVAPSKTVSAIDSLLKHAQKNSR